MTLNSVCGQDASHPGFLQPCSSKPRLKNECEADSHLYSTDEFRMYCFKILPCSKRYSHDWVTCPFAHPGEKARRRCVRTYHYGSNMCSDMQRDGICPRGDACPMTHSVFEFWLHPDRYRTQLCNDGEKCTRNICFFAHSISTLRVPAMQHQEQQQQQQQYSCSLHSTWRSSSSSLFVPSAGSLTSVSTSLAAAGSPLSGASLGSPAAHSTMLPAWAQLEQQHDVNTAAAMAAAVMADSAVITGCATLAPAQQQSLPVLSSQAGVGCFWKHSSMLHSAYPRGDTWLAAQQHVAVQHHPQQLLSNGLDITAQLQQQQQQLRTTSADTADLTELLCQMLLPANGSQAGAAHSQLLNSFLTLTGPAGHMPDATGTQTMQQHILMPGQFGTSAAATEVVSPSAAWPVDTELLAYASMPTQFGVSNTAASNGLLQQNNHGAHGSSAWPHGAVLTAGMGAPACPLL